MLRQIVTHLFLVNKSYFPRLLLLNFAQTNKR